MKKIFFSLFFSISALFAQRPVMPDILKKDNPKVQIGLLLDTSGSMNGLIRQAKEQLWTIVNEVAKANKNNKDISIEVGVFEYGQDTIPQYEGYLRMVSPLTTNLDLVSDKLFRLRTHGGEEYAGRVILEAVNRFQWSNNRNDLKILIIAGNESFRQGDVPYREAILKAKRNGIIVNTVFCGNEREGLRLSWKDGADIASGKYFTINQNDRREYIKTPYDDEIIQLGNKLNTTYIKYGKNKRYLKENIIAQDNNVKTLSKMAYIERNLLKSKKQYAKVETDMVSSFMVDSGSISKINKEALPEIFKHKNSNEIRKVIENKSKERVQLQKRIRDLENKRSSFLSKKSSNSKSFGSLMTNSIKEQARKKGFSF